MENQKENYYLLACVFGDDEDQNNPLWNILISLNKKTTTIIRETETMIEANEEIEVLAPSSKQFPVNPIYNFEKEIPKVYVSKEEADTLLELFKDGEGEEEFFNVALQKMGIQLQ